MKRSLLFLFSLAVMLAAVDSISAQQKPVGPYEITKIHVIPFEESTGEFAQPMADDDLGGFFNDLSTSLLVKIEITGPAGEFDPKRLVAINVTEGRKVKLAKTAYPGVLNENGKFFVPVWLYGSMCDKVTIKASITGQTKKSSKTRIVQFMCGE